jgi:hypothetical protein
MPHVEENMLENRKKIVSRTNINGDIQYIETLIFLI